MTREWRAGDVVNLRAVGPDPDLAERHIIMFTGPGERWVNQFGSYLPKVDDERLRPLVAIDPEHRTTVVNLAQAIASVTNQPGEDIRHIIDAVQEHLRGLVPLRLREPVEDVSPVPVVHAVMYRDHRMGTLCNKVWPTAEMYTSVQEKVTCPDCRAKIYPGESR